MFNIPTIVSLFEVLLVLVPALLAVAYVTVAERKTMHCNIKISSNTISILMVIFLLSIAEYYIHNSTQVLF